jgi:putative ABC transport system permease protein
MEEKRSNEHPMADSILAMMGVLGALGVLITFLSASLIINTLNALMTQQLRQIGVMKLVGGRSFQILGMYLTLIISYSVIALIIAVPLGSLAGYGLAKFMASMMGAVVQDFRFVPVALVVQVLIAFIIPLGAGFIPVNKGAKTNVRRAISDYRPNSGSSKPSIFSRGVRWLRWISRPILLSLRNAFRKKGRLILTVFTLTVGGAVFIGVFNVRSSMNSVMDQLMSLFLGDVTIDFSQPYKLSKVERDLLAVPGVSSVEGWGGAAGDILDQNDDAVTGISIIAPPQDTQLLTLDFVAGRWLNPGEGKAMVVSDTIYNYYPDLVPGDSLIVEVDGNREETWEVVGVFRYVDMFGDPMAYAIFDFVADKVNLSNQALSYRIIIDESKTESLLGLIQRIEQQLDDQDYAVKSVMAGDIMRESASIGINTLVLFLLIMAVLTAFVGSIGLMGTMSISVLERTREIGVMRTIGAVDFVVMQSVIIEALVIGMITWFLAIGLSFPLSSALLSIISQSMSGSAFPLTVTPLGMLVWFGIVVVLTIIASILPARNAARLTINEVLAYE